MPNPFPGMNPYLEAKSLWRDVRWRSITYADESLQPLLRPRYHVRIAMIDRCYETRAYDDVIDYR